MGAQAERSNVRANVGAETKATRETNREVWTRRVKTLAPVWTLLAMWVFFSLASSSFATWININNILSQVSTAGILAVGMTFVLLTAEIDLSIAAVMGLAGEVSVQLYHIHNVPEPIPLIAALLTAALCGAFSGLATTVLRIPSFMSTLAMSLIAEGLLLWTSLGRQYFQGDLSPLTVWIGSARVGGSNGLVAMGGDGGVGQGVMILLCAACLLIGYLVLRYTRFGRYVYMAGANPSAARLAGINTKLIVFSVLTICGFTAGRHFPDGRQRRHVADRRGPAHLRVTDQRPGQRCQHQHFPKDVHHRSGSPGSAGGQRRIRWPSGARPDLTRARGGMHFAAGESRIDLRVFC
jgi:ribose transport system permease protein